MVTSTKDRSRSENARYASSQGKLGSSVKGRPPLVLVTTVEVGEGRSRRLELKLGDDPAEAALDFCLENDLPEEVLAPLVKHIRSNLTSSAPSTAQDVKAQPLSTPANKYNRRHGALATPQAPDSAMGRAGKAPSKRGPPQRPAGGGGKLTYGGRKPHAVTTTAANGDVTVFDRLYDRAADLQQKLDDRRRQKRAEEERFMQLGSASMTWVSRQLSEGRDAGEYSNYGEKLYAEGLHDLDKRRAEAMREKAERDAEELKQLTLRPKLSRMALQLRRSSRSPWARLNQVGTSQTKARILEMKAEEDEAEMRECTFKPRINSRSAQMAAARTSSCSQGSLPSLKPSPYETLYEDASRRQIKQAALSATLPPDCTFSPQILDFRGEMCDDAASEPSSKPVSERLYQLQKQRDARAEMGRWLQENPVDPRTGLPLFKPQTGRGPAYERPHGVQQIGQYLHSFRQRQDDRKALAAALERDRLAAESQPHALGHSAALVANLKAKRFGQLFAFMTSGSSSLDLLGLVTDADQSVLEKLTPDARSDVEAAAKLLAQRVSARAGEDPKGALPPIDGIVNLRAFTALMEAALGERRGVPRDYLLPTSSKPSLKELTFQPAINAKSKILAEKLRPRGKPTFEILHRVASEIQSKHFHQLQAQEDATLRECTFAPDLSLTLGREGLGATSLAKLRRRGIPTAGGVMPIRAPHFEDLEHEVAAALREGEMLGIGDRQRSRQPTADGYQVPDIQRWTSDNEDFVAEMYTGALGVH